jgi:uncharacterized membrane protein
MTMTESTRITNRFGRKGGRGVRPWLLIPKVIAVAVYVGGLAAVLGLWIASGFGSIPLGDPRRGLVIDLVSRLMIFVVVPGLLVAMILGVALLLQLPRQFLRMRWLQVKLVSLAVLIPAGHLFCSSRLAMLRHATDASTNASVAREFTLGLALSLGGSIWIVILGRLKPRLGMRYQNFHHALPPDAGRSEGDSRLS